MFLDVKHTIAVKKNCDRSEIIDEVIYSKYPFISSSRFVGWYILFFTPYNL